MCPNCNCMHEYTQTNFYSCHLLATYAEVGRCDFTLESDKMGEEISRCLEEYSAYNKWGDPSISRLVGLGDILSKNLPAGNPHRDTISGNDVRYPSLLNALNRRFPALDESVRAKCSNSYEQGRCRADCPDRTVQQHYVPNLKQDLGQDDIKKFSPFNMALGGGWIHKGGKWYCQKGMTFETDGSNAWCQDMGVCPRLGTGASESSFWTAPYPMDRAPLYYGFDPFSNTICQSSICNPSLY